jgi:glycosyltransferase involved in cell wall biosynthesis
MLIEGMACGVPVIGSDSGEIPYVIGKDGIVLPEAHAAAWTVGIAELLESPARRAELGAWGRAKAEASYAWPIVARMHLDFFEKLLSEK